MQVKYGSRSQEGNRRVCLLGGLEIKVSKVDILALVQVSQVALAVKNPPTNAGEVRVHSLGCEDPLEDSMATHSSILA